MNTITNYLIIIGALLLPTTLSAQFTLPDSTSKSYTLDECVEIALQNQPAIKSAMLNEEINKRQIKANLAGWSPQINASATLLHNIELPVSVFPNQATGERTAVRVGVNNQSVLGLEARQAIFDNDLLLASRNGKFLRQLYGQNTEEIRISTIVEVSKAYYNVLVTQEQTNILLQIQQRQQKQLNDAQAQYESGLVDPTDYKRAIIALNNTNADLKRNQEMLKYSYAYLHQLMGVDHSDVFLVSLDLESMENNMLLDAPARVDLNGRIEMQQLMTQKKLQQLDLSAQKWNLFPTISAYINRNHVFQNDQFSELYNTMYPNSQVGLTLNLPLFQGTRRFQNIQMQKLRNQQLEQDIVNTTNVINTQYVQALALYESDLNDWKVATENVTLSDEVYTTIKLQYDEGVKTYLDLMVAETDLRTAQLNQLNTMLSVLSSKLDVMQSLGTINTDK